jgi:glycosyltransferase involved in cell wall biosynthesis
MKLNIIKVIDVFGWSYYFVNKEYQKYSRHNILIQKHDNLSLNNNHLMYIHGPNISITASKDLPALAKQKGLKVIGGYGGVVNYTYKGVDTVCCISPETYLFAINNYQCPVYFLTEFIDSEYFAFDHSYSQDRFVVGYVGSKCAVKRIELLNMLKYPVIKKQDWGTEFFQQNRTLDSMKEFYKSIDVLVLTSKSECMPRVVLEAMCCGVPVVSTNVGMIKVLLDSSCIVPVMPVETLLNEMNKALDMLKDVSVREKMAIRNRQEIEDKFSWKIGAPICDDVFEAVYEGDYNKAKTISNEYLSKVNIFKK